MSSNTICGLNPRSGRCIKGSRIQSAACKLDHKTQRCVRVRNVQGQLNTFYKKEGTQLVHKLFDVQLTKMEDAMNEFFEDMKLLMYSVKNEQKIYNYKGITNILGNVSTNSLVGFKKLTTYLLYYCTRNQVKSKAYLSNALQSFKKFHSKSIECMLTYFKLLEYLRDVEHIFLYYPDNYKYAMLFTSMSFDDKLFLAKYHMKKVIRMLPVEKKQQDLFLKLFHFNKNTTGGQTTHTKGMLALHMIGFMYDDFRAYKSNISSRKNSDPLTRELVNENGYPYHLFVTDEKMMRLMVNKQGEYLAQVDALSPGELEKK